MIKPHDLKAEFGERLRRERRLKQCRDDRDILNQDIAAALDVSISVVGRWLDGSAFPREEGTLVRLAAYFGVTPAWLRYGQEPREAPKPEPKHKPGTLISKPDAKPHKRAAG